MSQAPQKSSVRWHVLVLLAEGFRHGYEIWRELVTQGQARSRNPTAIYRALRAMEEDGLVTSDWQLPEAGPARRVYRLTAKGRRVLKE